MMPRVSVMVGDRELFAGCSEEEEARTRAAAKLLAAEIGKEMAKNEFVTPTHILLWAGLNVSDNVLELTERVENQEKLIAELRTSAVGESALETFADLAKLSTTIAERAEKLVPVPAEGKKDS